MYNTMSNNQKINKLNYYSWSKYLKEKSRINLYKIIYVTTWAYIYGLNQSMIIN